MKRIHKEQRLVNRHVVSVHRIISLVKRWAKNRRTKTQQEIKYIKDGNRGYLRNSLKEVQLRGRLMSLDEVPFSEIRLSFARIRSFAQLSLVFLHLVAYITTSNKFSRCGYLLTLRKRLYLVAWTHLSVYLSAIFNFKKNSVFSIFVSKKFAKWNLQSGCYVRHRMIWSLINNLSINIWIIPRKIHL